MASEVAAEATGARDTSGATTDEIAVVVPGAANVDGLARKAFERVVKEFAAEVLDEASHQEATLNGKSDERQYTSGHFVKARDSVRSAKIAQRPPLWYSIFRAATPVVAMFAGAFLPSVTDPDSSSISGFFVGLGVATVVGGLVAMEIWTSRRGR